MLMAATAAAATRMGGSAHSSSISPPPPSWHPVVLVPSHLHQQHQVLLYEYDHDLGTASQQTTPAATATATASPPRHNHLRPASRRRAGKPRRPRPPRKLPTTYISADAASFRRMVHQVTGADDVVLVQHQATAELLCRTTTPPSSRAALTTTTTTTETATLLLPTLDTSAFLLGAAARGAGDGGGVMPARPAGASCCHGSAVAVGRLDPDAALKAEVAEEACGGGGGGIRGGQGEYNSRQHGSASAGGFPSSESWDDVALF